MPTDSQWFTVLTMVQAHVFLKIGLQVSFKHFNIGAAYFKTEPHVPMSTEPLVVYTTNGHKPFSREQAQR